MVRRMTHQQARALMYLWAMAQKGKSLIQRLAQTTASKAPVRGRA